jgi:hypothetical protein
MRAAFSIRCVPDEAHYMSPSCYPKIQLALPEDGDSTLIISNCYPRVQIWALSPAAKLR